MLENTQVRPFTRREHAIHGLVHEGPLTELVQDRQPHGGKIRPHDLGGQPPRGRDLESRPPSLVERERTEQLTSLAERRGYQDLPGERVGLGHAAKRVEQREPGAESLRHRC